MGAKEEEEEPKPASAEQSEPDEDDSEEVEMLTVSSSASESAETSDSDSQQQVAGDQQPSSTCAAKAAVAYRDVTVLGGCTFAPLLCVTVLVLASIVLAGQDGSDREAASDRVQLVRQLSLLANDVAEEGRLVAMLAQGYTSVAGAPLESKLSEQRNATDRRLHTSLRIGRGDLAGVLDQTSLASLRASASEATSASAIVSAYGDVVAGLSRVAFRVFEGSLLDVHPQRRVAVSGLLLTVAGAGQDEQGYMAGAIRPLVAAGATVKTASEAAAPGSPLTWAEGVLAAVPVLYADTVGALRAAEYVLDEAVEKVLLLLAPSSRSDVSEIRDRLAAAQGQRTAGHNMLEASTAAELVRSGAERHRVRDALYSNSSRLNEDLDTVRMRLSKQVNDAITERSEASQNVVGRGCLVLLLMCYFALLITMVLYHFSVDSSEEEQIKKDFTDERETLHMLNKYCNAISVWLLDDIPHGSSRGQMELRFVQAVNALRVLRPFVPQWAFRNHLPDDVMEAATYVEAPKYKQPAELEAQNQQLLSCEASPQSQLLSSCASPLPPSESASPTPVVQQSPQPLDGVATQPVSPLPTAEREGALSPPAQQPPKSPLSAPEAAARRRSNMSERLKSELLTAADAERRVSAGDVGIPQIVEDRESEAQLDGSEEEVAVRAAGEGSPTKDKAVSVHEPSEAPAADTVSYRVLNLEQKLKSRDDVTLVCVSLRDVDTTGVELSTGIVGEALNEFICLVSDLCDDFQSTVVKTSPAGIFIGFNLSWELPTAGRHALIAARFMIELTQRYQAVVEAQRDELRPVGKRTFSKGEAVEVREKDAQWLKGEVVGLQPIRVKVDGHDTRRWHEVRPETPVCDFERVLGSPENNYPRMAAVTGEMSVGIVNTGTFRSLECCGPRVIKLLHLVHLCHKFEIGMILDHNTRMKMTTAPVVDGDRVDILEPADRVRKACLDAKAGLGWNDAMAAACGTTVAVVQSYPDSTIELQLPATTARFPFVVVKHPLVAKQLTVLESSDTGIRGLETICQLTPLPLDDEGRERQKKLDSVFRALKVKRYKLAERLLADYVSTWESVEVTREAGTRSLAAAVAAATTPEYVDRREVLMPSTVHLRQFVVKQADQERGTQPIKKVGLKFAVQRDS
eukprot:TRINITY_DN4124_c4_g4_i1.p1 TRINITY_DN4124_c4_g4~~TRINITY_DN4124_c4_g4_i1.p1  ORF type:complete len:1156 (+),score=280.96 TRINITY_DN4124_c4_g4_i1:51-3470(+)